MAIRYKALTELYQETQRKVTAPAEWQQFLTSACRNYRLSFDEQLLVYAQRPDATAVLEIERWNKRFGRWVNRGANGIAVFDGEHSGKQRLKYYFDVSDTHEGRFSRPVPLWTIRSEYAPDIIEALENSFGELEQKDNLGAALLSAAKNAVEDNIQRYLQYRTLQEMGLIHFDDWASNFGETVTAIELSPEGSGYRAKTRFAKFYNLPELMSVFKQVADIQTADMLHLPVPKANFHTEVIKPSEIQQEMIKGLAERAEKIRGGGVDPHVDNMLRITNDGRKLALDMRLIQPLAPDDPDGKVAVCARNIYRIWEQTKENRSAQLVFCDLSTPEKRRPIEMTVDNEGTAHMADFQNVYDDLLKKLIDLGIPWEEIAFIHDADSEAKKKELFAKVRAGQVRVLMGSTQKMGAGTNVQDRLIALHDLDCPWRPSDLQQRLGRIVRQGNENEEVEIFRYVTEGTFDAYLYQLVENKQKFIAQIMTSKAPVRVADDVDETALSYSEIKALATGNPLIIEKCNLDMEVARLNMLKASHLNQVYALEELVHRKYPAEITRLTERIAGYEKDVELAKAHPKAQEGFCGMEVEGKHYVEKEDAGKAIIDVCTKMTGSDAVLLGQYRGFSMVLAYDGMSNEYRITLKGTLSHTVTLGADVFGNITRLDNVLENLAGNLDAERAKLEEVKVQLENARTELATPFAREEELTEKTARLKELNILLNMDEKDKTLIDEAPDEGEEPPVRKVVGLER